MSSADAELTEAYQRCRSRLVTFVQAKVGCAATAADIVQDTYLRLAQRNAQAPVASPKALIFKIAQNLVLDHLRRAQVRGRSVTAGSPPEDVANGAPSAEAGLIGRQRLAALERAISELPPLCREVFVLRKIEELDPAEIAIRLGISRNTVGKHLSRALAHCLRRLDEDEV